MVSHKHFIHCIWCTALRVAILLHFSHTVDERDRIALLTYNTSVKQHFGLQEATPENKQIFQNAISSIIADGRTNLCDGLMKGKYAPL